MSNFTLEHYKRTLRQYQKSGYSITHMTKHVAGRQLILSHDVDMDITLVPSMAKAEHSINAVSTYFFRIGAKNYNLLSRNSIDIMRKVIEMGHDVGYHYEAPANDKHDIDEHIQDVMLFVNKQTGICPRYFNVHEPSRTGIDISTVLPTINRCYNAPFFAGFKYLSDSSAHWREGCFSEHVGKYEKMLVLTHPFWWFKDSPSENY